MLEPGPDEAANLRIPDPHVRGLQHHHPEPVHGVTRHEPTGAQEISKLMFSTKGVEIEEKNFLVSQKSFHRVEYLLKVNPEHNLSVPKFKEDFSRELSSNFSGTKATKDNSQANRSYSQVF